MSATFINKLSVLVLALWIFGCQTTKPVTQQPDAGKVSVTNAPPDEPTDTQDSTETDRNGRPVWAAKKFHYNPSRTRKCDLVHTKLDVRFDWGKQQLNGIATITLKPHFYPQTQLELDAKGFDLRNIQLVDDKTKSSLPLKYAYDGRKINIQLDRTYTHEENFTVRIDYTAKPNELPKGGSAAITSDKGLYFI